MVLVSNDSPLNPAMATQRACRFRSFHCRETWSSTRLRRVLLLAMAAKHDEALMREAIREMRAAGLDNKTGGPFGAVIAKNGEVVASAGNSVIRDLDPSAHAEVNAIRAACKQLGTWDLSGCVMYTSCECCPMCYAAAYWAGIRNVFYAASWSDYNDLFSDEAINQDMQKPKEQREIKLTQILKCEACEVWDEFRKLPNGARY